MMVIYLACLELVVIIVFVKRIDIVISAVVS